MEKTIKYTHEKMDYSFLVSQQLLCCLILSFAAKIEGNVLPFPSSGITNPTLGKAHIGLSEQSNSHTSLTSETAKFHIKPSKVKQMTETNLNLMAVFTEAPINTKSEATIPHNHRHQHKYRHMTHSLRGSTEHQWHQRTKFIIEPTPTQVQPIQTKESQLSDSDTTITSLPTDMTFTEVLSDFPKLSTSQPMVTSKNTVERGFKSTFLMDIKITKTATKTGIRSSISPVFNPPSEPETNSLHQTPIITTQGSVSSDDSISDQMFRDATTPENSILQTSNSPREHQNFDTTFKMMVNPFANLTEKSIELSVTNETSPKFHYNHDINALLNEAMINKTITSVYIQPTPILLMPHLKTKYRPSHFNDPTKDSTQRPARNILSLNIRGQSKWRKNSKDLNPSRSGLLHLQENDVPTSHAQKPIITHKKDFTSLPKDGDAKILAAVTTEFMKSSEVIPDLFVTPTKSQKIHSTKSSYEGQGRSGPSSITAALSFRSKEEHLILSATATLSPSRMTYTCTIPCSEPGCSKCCTDHHSALGTATTAITRRPPSNTTPNIQVSTDKSLTEQISLSAKFGIGMGCLIAIWLVVGPVICLICRIRDQVKESEERGGNRDNNEMEKRKKKQIEKSRSGSTKKEHPLTEAIVMDELSKQFTKKKNSRENEYLLLAKDKAELECLSRVDLSKTINTKPMSTFDRTRAPHCLKKWNESDLEDDSDEEEEEKDDRFTPVSSTPTVSV